MPKYELIFFFLFTKLILIYILFIGRNAHTLDYTNTPV